MTKNAFKHQLDRVYSRLMGWKSKYLSMAGRIIFINSVTSCIPGYAMQTTELPRAICDSIDKCNQGFLWRDSKQEQKMHLVSWNKVCKPKMNSGLGIRSMRQENTVMLAKLGWWLVNSKDSL